MSETTFFDQDGVTVTNARFVVQGTTYPIGAITSVRAQESKSYPLTALLLIVIGFGFMLGGDTRFALIGPIAIGLGVFWIVKKAKTYSVLLRTASGESPVLQSPNRERVLAIVEQLNRAIVQRG